MNNRLVFDGDSFDDYLYWQTQDRKILKRINQLIKGHLRKLLAAPARCRFVGAFAKKFEAILCVLTRIFVKNDQ